MIAVYDVVQANFLEIGDLIGHKGAVYEVKEIDDTGDGIQIQAMEVDLEDVEQLYLDPFAPVDLVAYKDDDDED